MGQFIDLTGKVFGRLTVISQCERMGSSIAWLCRCECGNEKKVRGSDLRSGKTQSCGCLGRERRLEASKNRKYISNAKNEIGNIYTYLTVIERAPNRNNMAYWKCQCKCGNTVEVSGTDLRTGHTKSCGCYNKEIAAKNMKKIQPLGAQANLKDLTGQQFGYLTVLKRAPSNTKRNEVQWICQCKCGNVKIVTGKCLRQGETRSCGCLGVSVGEAYINNILIKNNVNFQKEVKFEDLKDKSYLRFDFGIYNNNNELIKLIEFDGRQHSDINSIWHNDTVKKHDQMKNDYCKENNIELLRISYIDLDKISFDFLNIPKNCIKIY